MAGLIVTACSDRQGAISSPNTQQETAGSGSALQPAPTVSVIEEDVVEPGQPQIVEQTETAATETPVIRVQFDGVTFSYPAELITDVQTERVPVLAAASAGGEIPQPVRFVLTSSAVSESSVLTIQAVREKNGLYYASLPNEGQEQVAELEALLSTAGLEETNSQIIKFVNGQGTRTVVEEDGGQHYSFEGLTGDGRYLIQFTFPLAVNPDAADQFEPSLALIDSMIQTLYIDGAAESLNVTTCVDDAEYITSLTIPDGTEIMPGETFVKTWRMRNTGTCTWTKNYSWTFKGGDVLTLMDTTTLDVVLPGEEVDISVTLVAPETPGAYAGQWQLSGSNQFESVGPEVYYLIVVTDA